MKKIFSKTWYIFIAVITSSVVFMFAMWLPNIRLIGEVIFNSNASIIEKINFLLSFFWSIQTNFTTISASYVIIIALLFGVNIAFFVYYIRNRHSAILGSESILSTGGIASGLVGIGCASCGTFVLTSALTLFGIGGFLTILPFGGEEFGFLGVGLLMYSVYIIYKKISEPVVCEVLKK